MHIKTLTIPLAILATLAVAGTVAAHNATATPSCGGLSWRAWDYDKTVTNTIVVKVDGATVHQDLDFKSSDDGTSPWSQTVAHAWSVVINAPGTQYDRSFSGVWQACQTAPTTTVTETHPPTTPAPEFPNDPTTTTVVAVDIPPVPTTVTPSSVADVVSLTPADPVLPITGLDGTIIAVAAILVIGGVFLVLRGRRVQ